jgi:putative N6-adenine-specific DNA methylase
MKIIIKTLEGLEPVLAKELEALYVTDINILRRAVECEGNWAHLYKCNYQLRTALRVLLPIKTAQVYNQESLYDAVYSIDWSAYIREGATFAIDSVVSGETFRHSKFVVYKSKDAIVDQLREKYDKRPSINTDDPDIRINIHIQEQDLTILLDSTGKSLHLRNYKYRNYKAPLNEVLAAGIILMSDWDQKQILHDPMCGSGTFITEALMQAANIPSGKFIESFAFEHWPEFHNEIWDKIKASADDAIINPDTEFIASDLAPYAVRDVKKNLQKFPFKEKVKIFERDFFKTHGHPDRILFLNPPYNKRVELDDDQEFYKAIGDALKTFWQGSNAWLITGNLEAMKSFGLRPSERHTLFNGGIESKLFKFEMYEGSRKSKHDKVDDHSVGTDHK